MERLHAFSAHVARLGRLRSVGAFSHEAPYGTHSHQSGELSHTRKLERISRLGISLLARAWSAGDVDLWHLSERTGSEDSRIRSNLVFVRLPAHLQSVRAQCHRGRTLALFAERWLSHFPRRMRHRLAAALSQTFFARGGVGHRGSELAKPDSERGLGGPGNLLQKYSDRGRTEHPHRRQPRPGLCAERQICRSR